MLHRSILGTAVVAVLLLAPTVAQAAPVTVTLRVEGPTKTVFEGPVTTDVRTFRFTNETTTHTCDGTAALGGPSPTPVPVRNGALVTAAERAGFALEGTFNPQFGATFAKVGDQAVGFDPATSRYLVEYHDGTASQLGGCSDPIAAGDDVLYAYGTGSEPLLRLGAPVVAAAGSVALKVTDAAGAPVAGAGVGGATTGADGVAVVPVAGSPQTVKAEKAGTIRSNAVTLCVTADSDGRCGATAAPPGAPVPQVDGPTPAPRATPSLGRITSVREGRRFAHGKGPRVLRGAVGVGSAGLRDVRIRLSRNDRGRCARFDGKRERFLTTRRCTVTRARFFSVGTRAAWTYQLPRRLGRGRYVLDVRAVDGAGRRDATLQRGRNRVVFFVR